MSEVPLYCIRERSARRRSTKKTRAFQHAVAPAEREFFIDNLLVRIHFIIEMTRWTGLAPWEFELFFPGSLTSTFLYARTPFLIALSRPYRGTSLIRNSDPLGPYSRTMPRALWWQ